MWNFTFAFAILVYHLSLLQCQILHASLSTYSKENHAISYPLLTTYYLGLYNLRSILKRAENTLPTTIPI